MYTLHVKSLEFTGNPFYTSKDFISISFYIYMKVLRILKNLKPKAIIAGITENPETQFFFIHFFIDNSNANISLYTLSCPKLKFRYYLTFEIII